MGAIQTPAYILRRRAVLHYMTRVAPAAPGSRVLEIGCGRGELLAYLGAKGFPGVGLEISPSAAAVARKAVAPYPAVTVVEDPDAVHGRFEMVLALEVLEHIEDDLAALREWSRWLADGGTMILTVPAHERYWTEADRYGGHVRRYEREPLQSMVRDAGLRATTFWSFGFPLTALTIPLRRIAYRGRLGQEQAMSREERVLQSSFDSTREASSHFFRSLAEGAGLVFHWLQLPFLNTDLGGSYLVACQRTEAE